ncbi:MAG: DUF4136 domain-containing protein [Bacteroidetes bacterium]|nr:MAG: DUF4136 domain-containing protein [Bacteroidota bacterium]
MLSLLLLSSCASIKVSSDFDKTVNFSKFKTFEYFGWAEDSGKLLNEIEQKRIERAFGKEFIQRGMKYVEKDGDIIVTLYIVTEQKTQTSSTTVGVGYGGYGGYGGDGGDYGYGPGYGWGSGKGMSTSTTSYNQTEYLVGTLIIDVYDAKNEKLVWESLGKKTIDENPKSRDQNVAKSVAAIMRPYPIAPLKEK